MDMRAIFVSPGTYETQLTDLRKAWRVAFCNSPYAPFRGLGGTYEPTQPGGATDEPERRTKLDYRDEIADRLESWTGQLDALDAIQLHAVIAATVLQLAKRVGPHEAAQAVHDLAFTLDKEMLQ